MTIIGIDLGTCNSCVSVWRNSNIEIITDEFGNNTIPSIVSFSPITRYIGYDAKNQLDLNPENTFYEVKRLIGRSYDDESVRNDMELVTYKIEKGQSDSIKLKNTYGRTFSPESISAMILSKLKVMASEYLQEDITQAVITVPAYFNDSQRQATKDAATIAGLQVVRILNEPTAAALAYGLLNTQENKNIMVYDLGGGTLDVSLLNINNGLFEVLGSAGNTHLGGIDFDQKVFDHCINKFKQKNSIQALTLPDLSVISVQKLRKSCETAKKVLSSHNATVIAVKNFYNNIDLIETITRKELEHITKDLLILCLKPIKDILESTDMAIEDIDEIILVGGMTRMLAIRENIKNYFKGKEPNCSVNPDEVVSTGAAIQGYILEYKDDPFSINVTLLDIVQLSLGIETIGGVMDILINRNTIIPVSKKKLYSTDTDYVNSVLIKIYEGERKLTCDNYLVGEFELGNITPKPRGIPEIEVTFKIDVNGIITVNAEDRSNNNVSSIRITGNKNRLDSNQIEELIRESIEFELKDKLYKIKKILYYEIDDLCSNVIQNTESAENSLKEFDKKNIMEDINKIKTWLTEKTFYEREESEYTSVINRLKENYGSLILKINSDFSVKAVSSKQDGVDIHSNETTEINDSNIFELLELDEYNNDKETISKIKELREELITLCNTILNNYSSSSSTSTDGENIHDTVDDILLWIHAKEKPSVLDYSTKLEEIKNLISRCPIITHIHTNKNKLEELINELLFRFETPEPGADDNVYDKQKEIVLGYLTDLLEKEENIDNNDDYYIDRYNDLINNVYSKFFTIS